MRKVNYDPGAPLHDRYRMDIDFLSAEDQSVLEDMTLTINAFSAGISTPASLCAATASGIPSISPMPAPTARSPRCTTTSRG